MSHATGENNLTETETARDLEIALKQSKSDLEFAIEATGLGTWDFDPLTNRFSSNEQLKKWFGLAATENIELSDVINAISAKDRQRVTEAIQKALDIRSGSGYDIEYSIVNPATKSETIVRAKGRAWFNDKKVAYRFNGTLEDVTERAIAAKKIRESEQRLEAAMQAVNGIVWTNTASGEMRGEQKGWAALTGQKFEHYQGYGWADAIHPEDVQPTIDAWKRAVKDITTFRFEHRVKTKNGEWKYFSIHANPLTDGDGTLREWVGVHTDISDQKAIENEIRESERRFHHLIISSPSAIGILKGEDLVITTANDAIIKIWGKGEEIIGKSYFEALPELAAQGYKEVFGEVYRTGKPFNAIETPVTILQDGIMQLKYYNFLLYPQRNKNGDIDGIGIIATEVTERALLNKKISENEKRFSLLANSMPQHIWIADAEGNQNYFNRSFFDYSGLGPDQINHKGWLQIIHPDDKAKTLSQWQQAIKSGEDFFAEHRLRRHDGEYRWQLSQAIAERDDEGRIQTWVGTNTDIQEQKQLASELEKKIQVSEERYHLMVEEVQDYAILYLNKEGIVENWNAGAEKIKGYKPEEIIGKSFSTFYTPEDRQIQLPQTLLKQAEEKGRARQEGWRLRKDGTRFWAGVVITAVHDEKNNVIGFSKVTHDMTEKKKADDIMRKNSEELEKNNADLNKINKELQAFAYISSHDLQEPLRKIQIFTSRIMEREQENLSARGKDYFKRVNDAALRMQTLIDDLLAYSRTNNAERKYEKMDIARIVEEVKDDLKEELEQKHATIEANEICGVNIIPFQFRQLLTNMISNSLKFSKPDQPPHIKIESTIASGTALRNEKLSIKNRYCHIRISDNGIGFEPEYNDKIFELFQRLHGRQEYNGTGIGLAIVKKIVENHNGIISASGEPGKGATFDIFLPAE